MTVFPSSSALNLAQDTVEAFVLRGEALEPHDALPSLLTIQRACYVALYENPGRRLRAQYGSPLPRQQHLAQEIISNTLTAIQSVAAQGLPIHKTELRSLVYSIAILGPLERITSEKHLNPKLYGLYILSDKHKSSVVLPRRVGVETPQEQVGVAWREANIRSSEAVSMYRFAVDFFE